MNRTVRAAIMAAAITFGSVFLLGWFLGFDVFLSGAVGIVLAALAGALLFAADARSRSVETRVRPRFPGPPDNDDDSPEHPSDRTRDDERG
ncbi:MAG: hypothetical protein R3343_04690 [Nitriliruptorales bacterium]|nr:hypothetical protein [Nitriliruptorales bacterium]